MSLRYEPVSYTHLDVYKRQDQGVQTIYGGNAGLDKLLRIASGCRVHRQAVDIHTPVSYTHLDVYKRQV